MTFPSALFVYVSDCPSDEYCANHLNATKTVRAFCAWAPNTLRKNSDATVTPPFRISSLVEALRNRLSDYISLHDMTYAKYATFASR